MTTSLLLPSLLFICILLVATSIEKVQALVSVLNANLLATASSNNAFEHQVVLSQTDEEEEMIFHWNSPQLAGVLEASLIHTTKQMDEIPSWIGFGIVDHPQIATAPTVVVATERSDIGGEQDDYHW